MLLQLKKKLFPPDMSISFNLFMWLHERNMLEHINIFGAMIRMAIRYIILTAS